MPQHLHRHDELGHVHFTTISCYRRLPFFGTSDARNIVVRCMGEARKRLGFRWLGYVVMPEHVHWVSYPQTEGEELVRLSSVLLSLKTSVGRNVKGYWRKVWAAKGSLGHPLLDRWATGPGDHKPVWTTRGVDLNVATQELLVSKLDYCHHNPVKRGLAENAAQWPWSSYSSYHGSGPVLLQMDWDGCWPIN